MAKKPAVSIGIPAHNEEANIKNLLESICQQKQTNFFIKEIFVVSDGSTDGTNKIVKEYKDRRIRLIVHTNRQGKSTRLNEIFQMFTGDFLILIDADIAIKSSTLFEKIAKKADFSQCGIISVKTVPLLPSNFFEACLNYSVDLQMDIRAKWNNGNNYLAFRGSLLALDGHFAKSIHLPSNLINNDTILYFSAVKKGFSPLYLADLAVFYKSPSSFTDHVSQSSRFQTSQQEMQKFLSIDPAFYTIPKHIFLMAIITYFFRNPLYFLGYIAIAIATKFARNKKVKSKWTIASTTKNIKASY